jgi:hypothetical protein
MEGAVGSYETSVLTYYNTWHHTPEGIPSYYICLQTFMVTRKTSVNNHNNNNNNNNNNLMQLISCFGGIHT